MEPRQKAVAAALPKSLSPPGDFKCEEVLVQEMGLASSLASLSCLPSPHPPIGHRDVSNRLSSVRRHPCFPCHCIWGNVKTMPTKVS